MQTISRRNILWLEVAALSGMVALPHLLTPFLHAPVSGGFHPTDPWKNASDGLIYATWCLPILFILWSSGDGWKAFGIRRWRWKTDWIVLALLLACTAAMLQVPTMPPAELEAARRSSMPQGLTVGVSILFATITGAVYEEIFYRGYLISRLEELVGNAWVGVVGSGIFFGYMHMYQGVLNAVWAGVFGLVLGAGFVKCRSIWPLAIAHMTGNLVSTYWLFG